MITQSGCSSGVEHHVANVRVEGSNPFARSNKIKHLEHFHHEARDPSNHIATTNGRRKKPIACAALADGCSAPALFVAGNLLARG